MDYRKVLVANTEDDTLILKDIKGDNKTKKISLKNLIGEGGKLGPSHMDIGKDGSLYIVNSYDDSLAKINMENFTLIDLIKVGRNPQCIKIFQEKIYVLNSDSNSMSIIDEDKFTLIEDIFLGEEPSDIEIDIEGLKIFVTNTRSCSINVLDLKKDEISHISLDKQPVNITIENGRLFILSYVNNGTIDYSNISELQMDGKATGMSIKLKGVFTELIKIKDKEVFYTLNIDHGYLYRISINGDYNITKTYLGGMPSNIIWDGKKKLYISDSLNNILTIIDESEQKILSNTRVGKGPRKVLLL